MRSGEIAEGVYILAVGCCSAVGLTMPATQAAIRAGVSGYREHPFIVDRYGDPVVMAWVPQIPEDQSLEERLLALAGRAASESLATLGQMTERAHEVCVFLACPSERPGVDREMRGRIAKKLRRVVERIVAVADRYLPRGMPPVSWPWRPAGAGLQRNPLRSVS